MLLIILGGQLYAPLGFIKVISGDFTSQAHIETKIEKGPLLYFGPIGRAYVLNLVNTSVTHYAP